MGYSSRHYKYLKGPDEGEIQFKRALASLGIGLIYTGEGEAQVNGKSEKRFNYLQRRVPSLCEKHKITTVKEAQPILEDLLGYYNDCREHQETGEIPSGRWEETMKKGKGKIKPLETSIDLNWVFSLHETRRVKKDGTFIFKGRQYRVGRFSGEEVTVCLIPSVKMMIFNGVDKLCEFHL